MSDRRIYAMILCGIIIAIIIPVISLSPLEARRTTVRLKPSKIEDKKVAKINRPIEVSRDTVIFGSEVSLGKITFTGFDKPASSDKETFLIHNENLLPISKMKIELSYFTLEGELLHRREVGVNEKIPAKERRLAEIKSFDTQKSYAYKGSIASRRPATPFTVRIKILTAEFLPQ